MGIEGVVDGCDVVWLHATIVRHISSNEHVLERSIMFYGTQETHSIVPQNNILETWFC